MGKFFNQRVNNDKKNKIILIIIIIGILLVIVITTAIIHNKSKNKELSNAKIEIRDEVTLEINAEKPEKTVYFKSLENVNEDDIKINYENVNFSELGTYKAKIKVNNEIYEVNIRIVDTIAPNLELKDLTIEKGTVYKPEDFVDTCEDNSNKGCKISFDELTPDKDGKKIDYSNYTEEGTYDIKITAEDDAKNNTTKKTTLKIGPSTGITPNGPTDPEEITPPELCTYGSYEYDKVNYILSLDISNKGCAVESKLNQNPNVLDTLDKILINEKEKLMKEFESLNITDPVDVTSSSNQIPNIDKKGIVGYQIEIEVVVNNEKIEKYYLKADQTRVYTINKYNLK